MIISKNINQKALYEFVKKFKELGYLQQMGIIHKDELIMKFSIEPYEVTDVKQLFSISKTFTVAIPLLRFLVTRSAKSTA